VCDYTVLVGKKQTKPIQKGLEDSGYKKENLFIVNTLDEAQDIIGKIVKPKDVVLFENDLPDTYNE